MSKIAFELVEFKKMSQPVKDAAKKMLIECFSDNLDYKKFVYTNPDLELCLFAYVDNHLIGHVGITKRKIVSDGKKYLIGGVGDVAIVEEERDRGVGVKIMKKANDVLKEKKYDLGLLFCHPDLDRFYVKSGWGKKMNGKVYALKHGEKEDMRRTYFLPLKLSKKEVIFWNTEDVNIGSGDW